MKDVEISNQAETLTSLLRNQATVSRLWELPDKDIVIAGIIDITAANAGLGNVDNTSDVNKPVSTAQQTALNLKENTANKSNDSTFTANSATLYPTQQAVRTAVDTKLNLVNAATALVDAASMDLTLMKHTLTTSSATRTFTISYTGDDITIEVTLNTTASVFTFPATSLCVSNGTASGDNTLSLSGVSGDKYIIATKKIGGAYYVVAKNFGQ